MHSARVGAWMAPILIAISLFSFTAITYAQPRAAAPAEGQPTEEDATVTDSELAGRRLTREQINIIKVFEINLGERPAVRIPREIIDKILDRYPDDEALHGEADRRAFRGARGNVQLETIFDLTQRYPEVRDFYGQIEVQRDPPSMRTFRTNVHRSYILNYCATAGCHGGPNGGEFQLVRERPTSEETVYTNFYLLDSWNRGEPQDVEPEPQPGEPGDEAAGQRPPRFQMIDRTEPERSLLLQYGLSRLEAEAPHPDVPNWRARFRRAGEKGQAQSIEDWIELLYKPAPDYMIDFQLPERDQAEPPANP